MFYSVYEEQENGNCFLQGARWPWGPTQHLPNASCQGAGFETGLQNEQQACRRGGPKPPPQKAHLPDTNTSLDGRKRAPTGDKKGHCFASCGTTGFLKGRQQSEPTGRVSGFHLLRSPLVLRHPQQPHLCSRWARRPRWRCPVTHTGLPAPRSLGKPCCCGESAGSTARPLLPTAVPRPPLPQKRLSRRVPT